MNQFLKAPGGQISSHNFGEHLLNTGAQKFPGKSNELKFQNVSAEDGSIISESSSNMTSMMPAQVSRSPMENDNFSGKTDRILPLRSRCDKQIPLVLEQPTVAQISDQYQPQCYLNFPNAQIGTPLPSTGCMPPFQHAQLNLHQCDQCWVQHVYPIHQYQIPMMQQNSGKMPTLASLMTPIVDPMSYSHVSDNLLGGRTASGGFVYPLGTPIVSYHSTGSPGVGNTIFLPSIPFTSNPGTPMPLTPVPYLGQSSAVPPLLKLNSKKTEGCIIPKQISCKINQPQGSHAVSNSMRPSTGSLGDQSSTVSRTTSAVPKSVDEAKTIIKETSKKMDEVQDLWPGNIDYAEYEQNGCSNLYATWSGNELELKEKLQSERIAVVMICRTSEKYVYNVIFDNHVSARKAFLKQLELQIRMVPPKNSCRNWLRNPSPNFLVKFETKYRLVVKKGKAECHDIVGDLLMSNSKEQEGCLIWADQLKGHRIRVVKCVGNFMFPSGRVVAMKGVTSDSNRKKPLGWISYRCRYSRELFVTRRSWNSLGDYIYNE